MNMASPRFYFRPNINLGLSRSMQRLRQMTRLDAFTLMKFDSANQLVVYFDPSAPADIILAIGAD